MIMITCLVSMFTIVMYSFFACMLEMHDNGAPKSPLFSLHYCIIIMIGKYNICMEYFLSMFVHNGQKTVCFH